MFRLVKEFYVEIMMFLTIINAHKVTVTGTITEQMVDNDILNTNQTICYIKCPLYLLQSQSKSVTEYELSFQISRKWCLMGCYPCLHFVSKKVKASAVVL